MTGVIDGRTLMEDLRTQQIQALRVALPYLDKMIPAVNNIIDEFSGNRQEDTDEYMKSILNGLNWIFEVYNGTQDLINKDEIVIDKSVVNASVIKLNEANKDNNDANRAEAFKGILQFLETFKENAVKLTVD